MSPDADNEKKNEASSAPDGVAASPSVPATSKAGELPLSMRRDEDVADENPEDLILANPQWGGVAMLAAAASFDTVVPSAVMAANYTMFRNADLRGDGSLTDGTMTLENYFKEIGMAGELDENGNPKESLLDDYADLVTDAMAEQQRQRREDDLKATLSEAEIDAIPWVGDPDAVWAIGNVTASRKSILASLKSVRKALPKLAADNHWTEDERIHEERLVSNAEVATRSDDQEALQKALKDMKPETREAFSVDNQVRVQRDPRSSNDTVQLATSAKSDMATSTDARKDIKMQMAEEDVPEQTTTAKGEAVKMAASPTALTHPPDIILKEEFTVAAAPSAVTAPESPAPVRVADAATAVKAAAPLLNQSFDL